MYAAPTPRKAPTTHAHSANLLTANVTLMQCAPLSQKHFKSLYNSAPSCRMRQSLGKVMLEIISCCFFSHPQPALGSLNFVPINLLSLCFVTPHFHRSNSVLCCFAVALNFQSLGFAMDLNDGRFQDNGGCGYVLKPALLTSSESFDPGCSKNNRSSTNLLLKVTPCMLGNPLHGVVLRIKVECHRRVCVSSILLFASGKMLSMPHSLHQQ